MEIDAVGAHGGIVRLNASAEQARQLAVAKQTEILHDQGVSVAAPTASVVNNPSFSPAIYAQAAQYQLYTQSGTLASLAHNAQISAVQQPVGEDSDAIKAVDKSEGGSVNTLI